MSDKSPPREWFPALNELLVRDRDLDQLAPDRFEQDPDPEKAPLDLGSRHRVRVGKLARMFFKNGLREFGDWLTPRVLPARTEWPPTKLTFEVEKAALHVVLDWLKPVPEYPPYTKDDEKQELLGLRRNLLQLAEDRLANLSEPGAVGSTVPWEDDDDWETLPRLVRSLLRYMHPRKQARLDDLCRVVWEKDAADVTDSARNSAIHKANAFLAKRERRVLEKVRGEPVLRWT